MKTPLPRFGRVALLAALVATGLFAAEGNTAIQPVPRDESWMKRHEDFVGIAKKGGVGVLFLGDSITDFWRRDDGPQGGKSIWEKNFAPLHAANFGIAADRTQHVLWRMANGELDGLKPKAVVLMIGTNNTGLERGTTTPRNSTAETIAGVTAVVTGLRAKLPETKILLLAIFPRAEKPDDPQRLQVADVNFALARLHDGKFVHYLDIGPLFLKPDGTLPKEIMPDFLHPNARGYEIWAAAIREPLARLMQ